MRSHFRRLLGTALASTLIVGGLWGALSAPVSAHAIIDLEGLECGVHRSNGKCSIATTNTVARGSSQEEFITFSLEPK